MNVMLFRDYKEEHWHSMDVYADQLARHLRVFKDVSVHEYVAMPLVSRWFPNSAKYARIFFRYVVNPLGANAQKADVFHITDHANSQLLAVLDPRKTVITCHDLTAPYWMERHVSLTLKKRIRHAVEKWRLGFMKKAAKIIAVSQATKEHIVSELKIDPKNIIVIPEGVDELFRPTHRKLTLRLPNKYLLHVGTTYVNKNMEGLLSMFFQLAKQDEELYLVKIGDPWTSDQEKIIRKSLYADRILHLGFVSTRDLPVLYSSAIALVQPSYAEGFGFTVLEAMSCGCPVIVSDIPALREMAGNAAKYISPDISKEDIQRVESMIHDETSRKRAKQKGLTRALLYSWKKTASDTYNIYKEILKS